MSGAWLEFHVTDRNNTQRVLRAIRESLDEDLRELGDETLKQIDSGFETGADAMGRPWAPLAPSTIARKGHSRILIDTGEMRDSFEKDHEARRFGAVPGATLTISSEDEKLPYHEFGTSRMPARPVLKPAATWIDTEGIDRWGEKLGERLLTATF